MLPEVLEALAPDAGRTIVDCTFGAGGYTRALLDAGARVIAFDRDPFAARFAAPLRERYGARFALVSRPFGELEAGLDDEGVAQVDGVVFDLGVSSMQLDQAERGFSFMRDGPLDMRMAAAGPTAADLVNTAEEEEIARVIWTYGEERKSRRIASAIGRRRAEQPFNRTLDLAEVVERALGGRRGAPTHPATRTFQALRIAVNDELGELERALPAAERRLAAQGRLVVVSFHSLEDRVAKAFLAERAGRTPAGSRHLPPTAAGPAPSFELLRTGALAASEAESAANPRARSAKLRAAVRTPAPAWSDAA
ncbi:MAG: 16S rRNA (cytosine(1402)-N(4))-methyltransferase RsmH [Caulobacteraceae bacterium]|nr:16S rRNA (cytosine(1402)-N(4))-methyltransferase RsmH [Caulobacter sp.]